MPKSVKGIYRNGQIQLLGKPEGVDEAEVVVTFPDNDQPTRTNGSLGRREAARKWLRETGWALGGAPYATRDELHDRTR
jgi:hypothetical protein